MFYSLLKLKKDITLGQENVVVYNIMGASQVGTVLKNQPCQCRRLKKRGYHPWVGKILRGQDKPTSVFLAVKSQEQRSLVGYKSM